MLSRAPCIADFDRKAVLAKACHFLIGCAAVTFSAREKVDALCDIGLSLRILTEQQIDTGGKGDIALCDISVISGLKVFQFH